MPRGDPAAASKIIVVHCGIDTLFLNAPPTPVPPEPRLVCVGRLAPEKGQLLLLEALGHLVMEGIPCHLTLVGDGPLRAEIETRIARLGLQGQVTLLGWAGNQEVRQQMLAARALVVSSLAEGLPGVLIEAMSLGRPVISTDVGGVAELVQPGVNGWLIPAGSVEALASALRQVVQAPVTSLERLGNAGARTVRQEFSAPLQAQKMVALFQNYVAHPPQASGGRLDELSGTTR